MRIYLFKEQQCKQCNGTGVASNPIYQDLAAHMAKWRLQNLVLENSFEDKLATNMEEDRWMQDAGYSPDNWPPERCPCEDCAGTGKVHLEVDLADALHEIGFNNQQGLLSGIEEALNSGDGVYRP